MPKRFKKGERVSWRSHGTEVRGRVEGEITGRTEEAGRTVDATEERPQYLVTSERSGRQAVHKPGALKRRR